MSIRSIAREKRFLLGTSIFLGVAIGLTVAVFSVIDAIILKTFPFSDPDSLVFVWGTPDINTRRAVHGDDLHRWAQITRKFDRLAPFELSPVRVHIGDDDTATFAAIIGVDVPTVLGVKPLIGRSFAADDEQTERVALLSFELWKDRFGGRPNVVGEKVVIDADVRTIIGVMPDGFFFPTTEARLWLPLTRASPFYSQVHGIGRLAPNTSTRDAQAELQGLRFSETSGAATSSGASALANLPKLGVFPVAQVFIGEYYRAALYLALFVGLQLIAASANASNMFLSRQVRKRKEWAIRFALGATRIDLYTEMLGSALAVALIAGIVGVIAARLIINLIHSVRLVDVPRLASAQVNWRALAFGVAVAVLASVAAAFAASVDSRTNELRNELQGGAFSTDRKAINRRRYLYIGVEVAFAVPLVVCAVLLVNSFIRLSRADWGFNPTGLLMVDVGLPRGILNTPVAHREFTESVVEALAGVPHVSSAAMSFGVPTNWEGWRTSRLAVNGQPVEGLVAPTWVTSHGYFKTMGIRVLEGREFSAADDSAAQPVVVLSRTLAHRLWPSESALGKRITVLDLKPEVRQRIVSAGQTGGARVVADANSWVPSGEPLVVVGVVADVKMFSLGASADSTMYREYRQAHETLYQRQQFVVRTANPMTIVPAVQTILKNADGRARIEAAVPMSDVLSRATGGRSSPTLLLLVSSVLSGLALAIAGVGIYGVVTILIRQRTREIGVRLALGASRVVAAWAVIRTPMLIALLSLAGGILIAVGLAQLLKGYLYGVPPLDFVSVVIAIGLLLFTAALGCVYAALAVLKLDVSAVLRYE